MPIYAYRCAACGHSKDVLQKMSDPVLTVCPHCGADAFQKQVTAAGFQLKGSGWYVTDFRGGAKPSGDAGSAESADGKKADSTATAEAKNGDSASTAAKSDGASPAPAAAPAASPAATPAAKSPPPASPK